MHLIIYFISFFKNKQQNEAILVKCKYLTMFLQLNQSLVENNRNVHDTTKMFYNEK